MCRPMPMFDHCKVPRTSLTQLGLTVKSLDEVVMVHTTTASCLLTNRIPVTQIHAKKFSYCFQSPEFLIFSEQPYFLKYIKFLLLSSVCMFHMSAPSCARSLNRAFQHWPTNSSNTFCCFYMSSY